MLIMGGTRGIGRGVAEAMLAAGDAVTVTRLSQDKIDGVPTRANLHARVLDATSAAEVARTERERRGGRDGPADAGPATDARQGVASEVSLRINREVADKLVDQLAVTGNRIDNAAWVLVTYR